MSVIYLYGNLAGWRAVRAAKSEGIKHSWQITCDDQIMLTHEQQKIKPFKRFITVSISTASPELLIAVLTTGNLYTKRWSLNINWKRMKSNKNVSLVNIIIIPGTSMYFKKSLTYFGVHTLYSVNEENNIFLVCGLASSSDG